MRRIKPFCGGVCPCALALALAGTTAQAQPPKLFLASQIQYSQIIQGGIDPISAIVFNRSPLGSQPAPYTINAGYGQNYANGFGFQFTGTIPANGGSPTPPVYFNLDTANLAPGNVPVAVTLSNAVPGGGAVTQGGQFTVLAHARPSLSFGGGPPVSLLSRNVVTFQTQVIGPVGPPAFAEAAPTGTEAAGGAYAPQMLGDPPGVPTAKLDLDSFASFGSPNITTTLTPVDGLLSTDTPGTGESFNIQVEGFPNEPYDTDFNKTVEVFYSDEQDLPGADAPGSQVAEFDINVDIEDGIANWTITTDVPDGMSTAVWLGAVGIGLARAKRIKRLV